MAISEQYEYGYLRTFVGTFGIPKGYVPGEPGHTMTFATLDVGDESNLIKTDEMSRLDVLNTVGARGWRVVESEDIKALPSDHEDILAAVQESRSEVTQIHSRFTRHLLVRRVE